MSKLCPVLFRILFQIGSEQVLKANLVWSQFRSMQVSSVDEIPELARRKAGHRDRR